MRKLTFTGRLLLTRTLAALLTLGALSPLQAGTVPPPLLELAGRFGQPADGGFYIKFDQPFEDFVTSLVPFGELYRKVMDEQCDLFAARTGFHPIKDVQSLSIVASYGPGKEPGGMIFLEMGAKTDKFREALKKDGGPGHSAKFQGDNAGTMDRTGFLFTKDGVIFGDPKVVPTLKDAPPAKDSEGIWVEAGKAVSAEVRFLTAGSIKPPAPGTPPADGFGAILQAAKSIAVGFDAGKFTVRIALGDLGTAQQMVGMANSMIQGGLPALQKTAEEATKNATSAFDLISPQVVGARTAYVTGKQFADALVLANDANVATITAERSKLPAFNPNIFAFSLAAAAGFSRYTSGGGAMPSVPGAAPAAPAAEPAAAATPAAPPAAAPAAAPAAVPAAAPAAAPAAPAAPAEAAPAQIPAQIPAAEEEEETPKPKKGKKAKSEEE